MVLCLPVHCNALFFLVSLAQAKVTKYLAPVTPKFKIPWALEFRYLTQDGGQMKHSNQILYHSQCFISSQYLWYRKQKLENMARENMVQKTCVLKPTQNLYERHRTRFNILPIIFVYHISKEFFQKTQTELTQKKPD